MHFACFGLCLPKFHSVYQCIYIYTACSGHMYCVPNLLSSQYNFNFWTNLNRQTFSIVSFSGVLMRAMQHGTCYYEICDSFEQDACVVLISSICVCLCGAVVLSSTCTQATVHFNAWLWLVLVPFPAYNRMYKRETCPELEPLTCIRLSSSFQRLQKNIFVWVFQKENAVSLKTTGCNIAE